jgi:hypothetical protein
MILAHVLVAHVLVAHGGVGGAVAESSVLVLVLLIAGLAWRGSRATDDDEEPKPPPLDEQSQRSRSTR